MWYVYNPDPQGSLLALIIEFALIFAFALTLELALALSLALSLALTLALTQDFKYQWPAMIESGLNVFQA